jgi:glutamate-1-semialdehyde 2,1-aminomutase
MNDLNEATLARAERSIPWGTQTNGKRAHLDGIRNRPAFIKRARGCRMWDLNDREFIDYRAALGPIVLGYGHPAVDDAVKRQLENGVLFSMASPIEVEAAETILGTLAWPDQIRFMKTGVDVCASCLRLARSRTKRDHFLTSGYHGYQDWFAVAWPNSGIPGSLQSYVHEVAYGDIEAVERVFAQQGPHLAAALVNPVDWRQPANRPFLARIRELCDHYGAALIFDEVLTGFRLAKGGAREYFDIVPDMGAYAKGIANGYPLSAYAGKREWMQTLDQTVLTTTYAGETLSLAAAIQVMEIYETEPVHAHLFEQGRHLRAGMETIFAKHGFPATTTGLDCAPMIDFKPAGEDGPALHDALFEALYANGIFANEQWFITYAHKAADIDETLGALEQCVAGLMAKA